MGENENLQYNQFGLELISEIRIMGNPVKS